MIATASRFPNVGCNQCQTAHTTITKQPSEAVQRELDFERTKGTRRTLRVLEATYEQISPIPYHAFTLISKPAATHSLRAPRASRPIFLNDLVLQK